MTKPTVAETIEQLETLDDDLNRIGYGGSSLMLAAAMEHLRRMETLEAASRGLLRYWDSDRDGEMDMHLSNLSAALLEPPARAEGGEG